MLQLWILELAIFGQDQHDPMMPMPHGIAYFDFRIWKINICSSIVEDSNQARNVGTSRFGCSTMNLRYNTGALPVFSLIVLLRGLVRFFP